MFESEFVVITILLCASTTQKQAEEILTQCQRDIEVHKLPCNFVKRPGKTYYVYQKPDGSNCLCLLSPEVFSFSVQQIRFHSLLSLTGMGFFMSEQIHRCIQIDARYDVDV